MRMMVPAQKTEIRDMLGRTGVVSLAEAISILGRHLPRSVVAEERVSLENAMGRITAYDIHSPEDLPSFDRSVMDGYAVRAADTFGASESMPSYLEISGEVLMGEFPTIATKPGACCRIATGGLLPPGTDAVVKLEHTVVVDAGMVEVLKPVAAGEHVIATGEDVRKDEMILRAGHLIRPQDMGLLAGLGIQELSVRRLVRVGLISTGEEIVAYQETPQPGKIRDTNSVHLAALVSQIGARPVHYGIVADDELRLMEIVGQALRENDVVLFSGGSSVGSRDLGERVVEKMAPEGLLVHGVAIKPGKPVLIAVIDGKPVFGLPGHPVSAVMAFNLFVTPAIHHLAGLYAPPLPVSRTMKARLMRNINSAAGRTDFVRVRIEVSCGKPLADPVQENPAEGEAEAHPVLGKSGALSTLVKAHGYIVVPEKSQGVRKGEIVDVQIFD